jgi:hypothetical protein
LGNAGGPSCGGICAGANAADELRGGGWLDDVRPSKKGSSSLIDPSDRGGAPARRRRSVRETWWARMARWSSRNVRKVNCWPLAVFTSQLSPAASTPGASGLRTLNWWPHVVQRTVVPRPLTSASSNSYSVLHRSH